MKNKREHDRALAEYDIPFFGLKKGYHYFSYTIDRHFLEQFEDSPLQDAHLLVNLQFHKNKDNLFELDFDFDGTVQVACDRCLADLAIPVQYTAEVLIKVGNVPAHATDDELDVVYLSPDLTSYNVAQLMYEFVILNMPLQAAPPLDPAGNRLCPPRPDGTQACDEKVLAAIARTNKAALDTQELDPIDPRWAALQQLKK